MAPFKNQICAREIKKDFFRAPKRKRTEKQKVLGYVLLVETYRVSRCVLCGSVHFPWPPKTYLHFSEAEKGRMERIRLDDYENIEGDDALRRRMAGLQLPHMPEYLSSAPGKPDTPSLPQIRFLVVADLDLPSAAALAEYTLQQRNVVFDASRIDMCIACGPFSRDEDLRAYRSRRQRKRQNKTVQQSPFVRSREETAALEGLVTAALSQLENIVCRVIFCPGSTDPITTILPGENGREKLRLTPNSRNIHQQWLPLAPSLGCAGLLYLESPEKVVAKGKNKNPRLFSSQEDDDDEEDGEGSVEDILSEQIGRIKQRYVRVAVWSTFLVGFGCAGERLSLSLISLIR